MMISGRQLRAALKNNGVVSDGFPRTSTKRPIETGWETPKGDPTYGFTFMDNDRIQVDNKLLRRKGWHNENMPLDKALEVITDFVHKGWRIDYEIIDQVENGCWDPVKNQSTNGIMFPYTVTSYVVKPGQDPNEYILELSGSFDTLAEMYQWLAPRLERFK